MTWSDEAIAAGVAAWLESDPSMTNECVITRILDAAAAAVDGALQRKYDALLANLERAKEALSLAESVYRKNCVAEGEPSSVLDAMQSVLAELSADAPSA